MEEIGHWINGKHVAGTSGRTADVWNPATGEVQAKVALASTAEMEAAVADAAKAQPAWAAMNPQRRARVMMEFVRLLHRDMDKLPRRSAANTARPSPTPRATCSAGSRWSSSASARRTC
jgi:malonate-semialdehyde dehydrogenase (acetylating)/methylmalonate-semialdehyde dehydrogenase